MKLYEINEAMDALLDSLTVDPETGEVPVDADEIIAQIDELSMERQNVLEYLAKKVLNLRADGEAVKAELERLKERKESIDRHIKSIMNVLDRECGGEKTDLGVATISYRKSEVTEVQDEVETVQYLLSFPEFKDAVTVTEPKYSVNKPELKKLLKAGKEIPGCTIVSKNNCTLK